MKNLLFDIETTTKIKLGNILEKLTKRHNRREHVRFDMSQDDCDIEICASTQLLQKQKNQSIDLRESMERFCKVLPVFGFNSAKYDVNSIKYYLLPILVNEQDIEPTVIKRANQFMSFKFEDIQLLHIMNFLGGATRSFLKHSWRQTELQKQKHSPPRHWMVWSPWENAEYRNSPIWRLLQ